jgi:hypothetical protein
VYISNDGVNSAEGYPLGQGDRIDIPASPVVRTFAVRGTGDPADVRTLELG